MEKIDRVMAEFRKAMLNKFHKKEAERWIGWDEQHSWALLVDKLLAHVGEKEFSSDNLIDIALLCVFLWNLETE